MTTTRPVLLAAVVSLMACQRGHSGEVSADSSLGSENVPVPAQTADLVLRNATIVTVDDAKPHAEALAIRGDTIVAVGSDVEIRTYIGAQTRVLDLAGQLVIPGFIEGHGHFTSIGDAKLQLDLGKAERWDDIVRMVGEAAEAAPPGAWIRGRGWHQEKWIEPPTPSTDGLPHHRTLSAASPNHPVMLRHASGHASFVNAKALELAGVSANTPNPHGGEIVRDKTGKPTGALRESAQGLVGRVFEHEESEQLRRKRIELATGECLSKGVTSFQDAGSSFADVDLFKKMAEEGSLGLRLWVMVRESNERLAELLPKYKLIGYADKRLTVRAIKRSIDGALGSHGAWLLDPYEDLPSSRGLNTTPLDQLRVTALLAKQHGFQVCVHAIGDRGNRETLDVFEAVLGPDAGNLDHRWRVEHAQHLHPNDVPRFARIGAIASMQGVHCTSDGPWVALRLGEKRAREGAYVWRKLKDAGAVVTNGTDAPVEDVSPIGSYWAMVSRTMPDGKKFFAEQALGREEALHAYTLAAAYAAFEEDVKGSLTPGKLADVTVLSQNILTVPEQAILRTEVVYTIVAGKIAYARK